MVAHDRIDCAIATGSEHLFADLTLMPCYRWYRTVIVPHDHPLASGGRLSFRALSAYPIVTYTFSFTGPSSLHEAFAKAGFTPNVAITARDADVIKTYVRLGLGVGIVARMAVTPSEDADLTAIDSSHMFPAHTTWIGFRRGTLLRKYMYDFAQLLAPHLDRRLVDRAHRLDSAQAVAELFVDQELPER
jgi:LysR family cys regulon transcriptional activator